MVLAEEGFTIEKSADDNWIKIYDLANSVIQPTSFAYIPLTGNATGWEACFPVAEGSYSQFEVHAQIFNDRTSRTNPIALNLDCGALPVEMTSFSAINNNLAQLNWETATEVNNYGFEIESNFCTEE